MTGITGGQVEPASPPNEFAPLIRMRDANRAPLTKDDVAGIVRKLQEHLKLWRAETDASHAAIEAKLRRERAMGALLARLKGAGLLDRGGRPPQTETDDKVSTVSLDELGIKPEQSSRWQFEARVPEHEFVTWIEKMKACDGEISSAALRRLATGLGLCRTSKTGADDEEFKDIDTSMPDGPCPTCGRTCDCVGEAS